MAIGDVWVKRGKWAPAEIERLREVVEAYGTDWRKVVARMGGRSTAGCKKQWGRISMPEARREVVRLREQARRQRYRNKYYVNKSTNETHRYVLSDERRRDRERVSALIAEVAARPRHPPTATTAILMGDPPPGRSALDARDRGI